MKTVRMNGIPLALFRIATVMLGLAGLASCIFLAIYLQVLNLKVFSTLTKDQTFKILRLLLTLVFLAVIILVTISAWNEHQTFPLTVFVHGEKGYSDLILKGEGHVLLDAGPNREAAKLGEHGEAYFPAVPQRFRNGEVRISVEANGFEQSDLNGKYPINDGAVYITIRRKASHIVGVIVNDDHDPVPSATVSTDSISTNASVSGEFDLLIPGSLWKPELLLHVNAIGYKVTTVEAVPGGNETTITLHRE